MMHDAIRSFPEQFNFKPVIKNSENLVRHSQLIICGLGGSHLSADVFQMLRPHVIRAIHSDYGLPNLSEEDVLHNSLIVLSSYSGNTEEVIESYEEAKRRGLSMCVMAVGGKLIEMAERDGVPYIQFPDLGIQPRAALGFGVMALAKISADTLLLEELSKMSHMLDMNKIEAEAKVLAEKLHDSVPLVYASAHNAAIAQNWKIKFNENSKIPAFWNTFPELNHNEMTGFDAVDTTRELSRTFHVLMFVEVTDHPRNTKRLETTRIMYEARGIPVTKVNLHDGTVAQKIFIALLLADWTSVFLGEHYGVETEQVPMVEEFKKLI